MTWRRYLQLKTREPAFLWRMSLTILVGGVLVGLMVDGLTPPAKEESLLPGSRGRDAWVEVQTLADQSQWLAAFLTLPRLMAAQWRQVPALTFLALLTGMAWMAFSLQAIEIRSWRDHRLWAPLAALLLGVISTWLTLFFVLWQERAWGLEESQELAGGLRYFILGVGLREELSKLLCLSPLMPWLVWRRDELAALVCGGCVGIGFGMEENIGYISSSDAASTLGRLLTALPLHMALTGLMGLALYRACRWPRTWGPQFVGIFTALVIAHGLYDVFIAVPALEQYSLVSGIIFVLVEFEFFRELRPLIQRRGQPISLTGNFLACVSLVAAANIVYLCAAVGWRHAGEVLAAGLTAQGVMVYLFLREMPERIG
jgi:RsiW-degrading membrane proteinase PrsW (M82 family)